MLNSGKIFMLTLTLFFFAACGKKESTSHSEDDLASVSGALSPVVARFKDGKNLSACDLKNLAKIKEIAAAVDQHQSDVDTYLKEETKRPVSEYYKEVQVGPMLVRELIKPREPKTGWQSDVYSWDELIKNYDKILKYPVPYNWYWLNAEARNLISNDASRITWGNNFASGKDDESTIASALKSTQDCLLDAHCTTPQYETQALIWLQKQRDYADRLQSLKKSENHDKAFTYLNTLESDLTKDLKRFQFNENQTVTRDGKVLHLPLYTTDFSDAEEALSHYIESVWTSADLQLKVDWKGSNTGGIYTFFYDPSTGTRSYTSFTEQLVMLFNNTEANAIAHETGHVLGFRDHYFETWDESQCAYTTAYREDDLMSGHTYGQVLKDEWDTLNKTYPASTLSKP